MTWSLERSYDFSQGQVAYDIKGSGPPVVLVHGTPWSSFTWHHVIDALAERYTVHYYDLIGYGRSEMRDGQDVSLGVQNVLLAELLDLWGLEAPMVVAHDFGGATALRAHILGERDFARIALMNVVALAPWGSSFFQHVQRHEAAFTGLPPYIHKAIVEAYIRTALYGDLDARDLDALVAPWLSDEGQRAFYRQIVQADQKFTDEVEERYGKIDAPVSILWGVDDAWIPIGTGERLHQAIPGSSFEPIPRAGHLVQLDQPDAVISSLLKFLD
ncbi:MAG: alpha/beta fold hydrolase [Hyphomicrobiales bacterium]